MLQTYIQSHAHNLHTLLSKLLVYASIWKYSIHTHTLIADRHADRHDATLIDVVEHHISEKFNYVGK